MKLDFTRQQPFASLTTLFVMSVMGAFALCRGIHSSHILPVTESLLGGYIDQFQASAPIISAFIVAATIFVSSIKLGRTISMQHIFDKSTSIHIPIAGLLCWNSVLNAEYLVSGLITLLVIKSLSALLKAVRSGENLSHIFNGAMALSILPLLYPPAIFMWLALYIFLIIIVAPLRSWIVATVGVLLPSATIFYIMWLCGEDFIDAPLLTLEFLTTNAGLMHLNILELFRNSIMAIMILLSFIAMLWINAKVHRTRVRLLTCVGFMFVAIASTLAPSSTLLLFNLLAPSLTILTTISLIRLHSLASNIIYPLLLIALVLEMFAPIIILL